MRRYRLSVPAADTSTNDWIAAQADIHASFRALVTDDIEKNGYSDVTCRRKEQLVKSIETLVATPSEKIGVDVVVSKPPVSDADIQDVVAEPITVVIAPIETTEHAPDDIIIEQLDAVSPELQTSTEHELLEPEQPAIDPIIEQAKPSDSSESVEAGSTLLNSLM